MSSLRFTKAPAKPFSVPQETWDAEWIGLVVGLASVFPLTIGYLGLGPPRIYDDVKKTFQPPTEVEVMNWWTNGMTEYMWISRFGLIEACKYSTPPRPVILAWLEEDGQQQREYFAVGDASAQYLP
jgi:hypothetical protein